MARTYPRGVSVLLLLALAAGALWYAAPKAWAALKEALPALLAAVPEQLAEAAAAVWEGGKAAAREVVEVVDDALAAVLPDLPPARRRSIATAIVAGAGGAVVGGVLSRYVLARIATAVGAKAVGAALGAHWVMAALAVAALASGRGYVLGDGFFSAGGGGGDQEGGYGAGGGWGDPVIGPSGPNDPLARVHGPIYQYVFGSGGGIVGRQYRDGYAVPAGKQVPTTDPCAIMGTRTVRRAAGKCHCANGAVYSDS